MERGPLSLSVRPSVRVRIGSREGYRAERTGCACAPRQCLSCGWNDGAAGQSFDPAGKTLDGRAAALRRSIGWAVGRRQQRRAERLRRPCWFCAPPWTGAAALAYTAPFDTHTDVIKERVMVAVDVLILVLYLSAVH